LEGGGRDGEKRLGKKNRTRRRCSPLSSRPAKKGGSRGCGFAGGLVAKCGLDLKTRVRPASRAEGEKKDGIGAKRNGERRVGRIHTSRGGRKKRKRGGRLLAGEQQGGRKVDGKEGGGGDGGGSKHRKSHLKKWEGLLLGLVGKTDGRRE